MTLAIEVEGQHAGLQKQMDKDITKPTFTRLRYELRRGSAITYHETDLHYLDYKEVLCSVDVFVLRSINFTGRTHRIVVPLCESAFRFANRSG